MALICLAKIEGIGLTSVFRYPADRLPVAIIVALTCLDFAIYFQVEQSWILLVFWLVMMIPKGKIGAWNHHHQHTPTFKKKPLNRLLELSYALHTGATTNVWVLHHTLGHHMNFLDQQKDESRWQRKSGEVMGKIEYTLNVAATAHWRAYHVGKRFPKIQRAFLLYTVLTFLFVAMLTWFKPVQGLFLFVLPMLCGVLLTSWATFKHHAGLPTDNEFAASRNNLNRFYNITTGNLGYHTAHHYKQGVHWSRLPELHEQIKDKIPEELISSGLPVGDWIRRKLAS
ncbi:MAG: fatty acid desaturase [Zetaproteobacteria bacterium CG_4_9_14_3_um_filter_49_83]|nr:MAG: fatty acid desaturase [Zetaproteobacteria bacterium CG1_02_49_23]PIQ34040.1 MAG: fatty acid desaturase [Zetaproteobacteria bacterium CG17_big_fil_post_rev_8_21_14_2_50_50_13]PIV29477.1 MAG: fatty acid desaturase [Zetaproteobacteria bacterium CG02_land_8_20_14_3_00_50_9]PIY55912.1 MAG: fatty acid desaturase [Zetaproteobacteria bacterium CG_4_10_14_0_8_um_filter_49_80]PJA35042.1 MAG: fatty acid desaturase [Zetaproteobacteria bacterium CG_4_9_14_3_um_filter_49_83]